MIRISSIAQLASLKIPDDELVMISSQFENPDECFSTTLPLAESLCAKGASAAGSEMVGGIIQEGNPIPSSLVDDLSAIPMILLRPPRESDLFMLSAETAHSLGRGPMDGQHLNSELLSRAIMGSLRYSSIVSGTFQAANLPELGPDVPLAEMNVIEGYLRQAFETEGVLLNEMDAACVRSGILLLWNLLDESHSISQTMEGLGNPRTGDYWHGIMHRREPDPGNAAYWFRRVGSHPAYESLMQDLRGWLVEQKASESERQFIDAELLKGRRWDPVRMIELCQQAMRQPGSTRDLALRRVQYLEILNLLAFSLREGTSES